jgi:hypothetical protein
MVVKRLEWSATFVGKDDNVVRGALAIEACLCELRQVVADDASKLTLADLQLVHTYSWMVPPGAKADVDQWTAAIVGRVVGAGSASDVATGSGGSNGKVKEVAAKKARRDAVKKDVQDLFT